MTVTGLLETPERGLEVARPALRLHSIELAFFEGLEQAPHVALGELATKGCGHAA